jgi:hypothetical protein
LARLVTGRFNSKLMSSAVREANLQNYELTEAGKPLRNREIDARHPARAQLG